MNTDTPARSWMDEAPARPPFKAGDLAEFASRENPENLLCYRVNAVDPTGFIVDACLLGVVKGGNADNIRAALTEASKQP